MCMEQRGFKAHKSYVASSFPYVPALVRLWSDSAEPMHYSRCGVIGKDHRLESARAKGLKQTNSADFALKILHTPYLRIRQGKPVWGWRSRWFGRLAWESLPISSNMEYEGIFWKSQEFQPTKRYGYALRCPSAMNSDCLSADHNMLDVLIQKIEAISITWHFRMQPK